MVDLASDRRQPRRSPALGDRHPVRQCGM